MSRSLCHTLDAEDCMTTYAGAGAVGCRGVGAASLLKLMGWTAPATALTCQDEVVGEDLIERSRRWRKLARSVWTWRRAFSRSMGSMRQAGWWCAGSCVAERLLILREAAALPGRY